MRFKTKKCEHDYEVVDTHRSVRVSMQTYCSYDRDWDLFDLFTREDACTLAWWFNVKEAHDPLESRQAKSARLKKKWKRDEARDRRNIPLIALDLPIMIAMDHLGRRPMDADQFYPFMAAFGRAIAEKFPDFWVSLRPIKGVEAWGTTYGHVKKQIAPDDVKREIGRIYNEIKQKSRPANPLMPVSPFILNPGMEWYLWNFICFCGGVCESQTKMCFDCEIAGECGTCGPYGFLHWYKCVECGWIPPRKVELESRITVPTPEFPEAPLTTLFL